MKEQTDRARAAADEERRALENPEETQAQQLELQERMRLQREQLRRQLLDQQRRERERQERVAAGSASGPSTPAAFDKAGQPPADKDKDGDAAGKPDQ